MEWKLLRHDPDNGRVVWGAGEYRVGIYKNGSFWGVILESSSDVIETTESLSKKEAETMAFEAMTHKVREEEEEVQLVQPEAQTAPRTA